MRIPHYVVADFVGADEDNVVHYVNAISTSAYAACVVRRRVYTRETEAVTCLACLCLLIITMERL